MTGVLELRLWTLSEQVKISQDKAEEKVSMLWKFRISVLSEKENPLNIKADLNLEIIENS